MIHNDFRAVVDPERLNDKTTVQGDCDFTIKGILRGKEVIINPHQLPALRRAWHKNASAARACRVAIKELIEFHSDMQD